MNNLERFYDENEYGENEKHFLHHATVSLLNKIFLIDKIYIKANFFFIIKILTTILF